MTAAKVAARAARVGLPEIGPPTVPDRPNAIYFNEAFARTRAEASKEAIFTKGRRTAERIKGGLRLTTVSRTGKGLSAGREFGREARVKYRMLHGPRCAHRHPRVEVGSPVRAFRRGAVWWHACNDSKGDRGVR